MPPSDDKSTPSDQPATAANAVEPPLGAAMRQFTERVDRLHGAARTADLLVVSFLGLFLEVLLIRWHASELVVAAYFKNITLLASFLGLGLGFAAAARPRLSLMAAPLALAVQVLILSAIGGAKLDELLRHPSGQEWVWGVAQAQWDWTPAAAQTRYWIQAGVFYGFFAALFVSTILIFIPIGQLTGRLMLGLPPIRAYTINIVGSLAGVAAFAAVSWLWLPPAAWFGVAGVAALVLLRHERLGAAVGGACVAIVVAAVSLEVGGDRLNVYSPYQRLEVERDVVTSDSGRHLDAGALISANKAYHLRAVNLASDFVAAHGEQFPRLRRMAAAYDLPYSFVNRPGNVLVVGAGGGNDVAAALRAGAGHVDAIEIDPAIVGLGRRFHAEQPYADPSVRVVVDDARAFMRRAAPGTYDLIVFGLLDSHTLLSGMSAVRLDNFVYTIESLKRARELLKPDGVVALSFATGAGQYLFTRLYRMLETAFGVAPRVFALQYDDGHMLVAGSGKPVALPAGLSEATLQLKDGVAAATDNWPFLYLEAQSWDKVPRSYFVMLGMLAVIAVVWILAGSGRQTGLSPHFLFLGGAFLLIETKGITELALIYGTTWVVSSVVIAAILGLILVANLFVSLRPLQNRGIHYGLLAVSLLAGYFVRLEWLLAWGFWPAAVIATALLVTPLFFAGVIFATSLAQAASLPRVFASNLLGAILGGLCEYASMASGFRNLYLVGLGLYGLSFVTMPRRRAVEAEAARASAE